MEIGEVIEFRCVDTHWPKLSAMLMPKQLCGEIPRDKTISAAAQADKLVKMSAWCGQPAIDAKSEAGRIIKGKRPWYNDDDEA